MSTKPTIVSTLNNREEEIELFRDLVLTKFHALWKELQFQQRMTRGLSKDELLHLLLACVNDFAAEVTVAELDLSRADFLEVMGESFDDALASLEFEDDEEDAIDEEDRPISETSTSLQSLIDNPLGKPSPAKDSQP